MKKKMDLRVIKTKNSIYNALVMLLKNKAFEEIKVSDICKMALINRSTFYAHFEDKYELFSSFIEDLKNSFAEEIKKIEGDLSSREYYLEIIRTFLNHIEGKEDLYKAIMINNRNSIIMDMIRETINIDIKRRVNKDVDGVPADIISYFYLGAVVNVGAEWINGGKKYSKEEMFSYFEKLIK